MGNSSSSGAEGAQGGGEKVPIKPRRLFLTMPDYGRKSMIEYLDMRDMVQLDTAMAHEGHERMALHEAFRGCVVYGGTFFGVYRTEESTGFPSRPWPFASCCSRSL